MSGALETPAKQLKYTLWAHARLLEALRDAEPPPREAVRLFGHILRAQDHWWSRVQGTEEAPDLWGDDTLALCIERLRPSTTRWHALVQDGDLGRTISYVNSSGDQYTNSLRDVVLHVVNHGTHHRAQIARELRAAGMAAPPTGYIYYLRDQE